MIKVSYEDNDQSVATKIPTASLSTRDPARAFDFPINRIASAYATTMRKAGHEPVSYLVALLICHLEQEMVAEADGAPAVHDQIRSVRSAAIDLIEGWRSIKVSEAERTE